MTWEQAQHDCRLMGSTLASIHSQDENWVIHRRLREGSDLPVDRLYWIGLRRDSTCESKLHYEDGLCWIGLHRESTCESKVHNVDRLCWIGLR